MGRCCRWLLLIAPALILCAASLFIGTGSRIVVLREREVTVIVRQMERGIYRGPSGFTPSTPVRDSLVADGGAVAHRPVLAGF